MRKFVIFLIVMLSITYVYADEIITNSAGKRVLLKDDFTWEYVIDESSDVKYLLEELITINSVEITDVNSVHAVRCRVSFKNISDLTFKYIVFKFQVYNRVDDLVKEEIRGVSFVLGKGTGPFEGGKDYDLSWSIGYFPGASRVIATVNSITLMNNEEIKF